MLRVGQRVMRQPGAIGALNNVHAAPQLVQPGRALQVQPIRNFSRSMSVHAGKPAQSAAAAGAPAAEEPTAGGAGALSIAAGAMLVGGFGYVYLRNPINYMQHKKSDKFGNKQSTRMHSNGVSNGRRDDSSFVDNNPAVQVYPHRRVHDVKQHTNRNQKV